jgi:hypothetical protein
MSDQPTSKAFLPVIGLGRQRSYFPARGWNRWGNLVLSFLLFSGALLAFGFGIYSTYLATRQYGSALIDDKLPAPLGLASILFLLGLWAGWNAYANWSRAVAVYENGFAYHDRNGLQIWRWDEIVSLTSAITRHYINGIYTGTTHRYTAVNSQGRRLILSNSISKVEELGKTIDENITPRLYAQAAGQYNNGQTIEFGPVTISKTGMDIGKKTYPWEEIKEVSIRQGVLKISRKNGGWFSKAGVSAAVIPNLRVLLAVLHQVVGLKEG